MFGETEITGERIASMDNKHRVTIPAFTKVEEAEELIPQFNVYSNILLIYSKDEYYRRTDRFKQFIRDQKELKKMTPLEIRNLERFYYGHLSFMSEMVDREKRLLIPERAVSKLELSDKIFIVGRERHLELCKDKETYERIIRENENRRR